MEKQVEELKTFIIQVCENMNMTLPAEVDEHTPIQKALELDSISMFELIVNLEEQYGVKVADDDIEKIGHMTISELLTFIEGQKVHG